MFQKLGWELVEAALVVLLSGTTPAATGSENSRGVREQARASMDRTSDSLAWQGAGVLVMPV